MWYANVVWRIMVKDHSLKVAVIPPPRSGIREKYRVIF